MASCPRCGHRPIRKKFGIRQCRHCGVLPEALKAVRLAASIIVDAVVERVAPNPWKGCCRDDSFTPRRDDYAGVGADEMCRDCPCLPRAA